MKLEELISEIESGDQNVKDAVIIQFGAFAGLDVVHDLDMRLFEGIPSHIGQHDGHEVAMDDSHGTLFTYGENAEVLFKTMQPILNEFKFLEGATVYLEFKKGRTKPLELEFDFKKN